MYYNNCGPIWQGFDIVCLIGLVFQTKTQILYLFSVKYDTCLFTVHVSDVISMPVTKRIFLKRLCFNNLLYRLCRFFSLNNGSVKLSFNLTLMNFIKLFSISNCKYHVHDICWIANYKISLYCHKNTNVSLVERLSNLNSSGAF